MKIHRVLENKNSLESNILSNILTSTEEAHFSFKMIFNGQQQFKLSHKELFLFPDSFIVFEPGTKYQNIIDADEPIKTFSVSITQNFIKDFQAANYIDDKLLLDGDSGELQLPVPAIYNLHGDMSYTMRNLYKALAQTDCDELLINEYMNHCLSIYYTVYHQELNAKLMNLKFVRNTTKQEVFKRLNLAKEFISNNYNKKFSLEDIAAVACLSVNHLLRTFKQAYGISPYQYLTMVRLNRAKNLLETGKFSVNEIVLHVGFESPSSFIKLFKNNFNCTPLKHRKSVMYQLN